MVLDTCNLSCFKSSAVEHQTRAKSSYVMSSYNIVLQNPLVFRKTFFLAKNILNSRSVYWFGWKKLVHMYYTLIASWYPASIFVCKITFSRQQQMVGRRVLAELNEKKSAGPGSVSCVWVIRWLITRPASTGSFLNSEIQKTLFHYSLTVPHILGQPY